MSEGGNAYGSANLPCELGSGSEGPHVSHGNVAGGGMIGEHSANFQGSYISLISANQTT